jgi:hypothetical protein
LYCRDFRVTVSDVPDLFHHKNALKQLIMDIVETVAAPEREDYETA